MRLSMINEYEIVINDFNKNRWERYGYINYRTYANRIGHELRTKNEYQIRKVFYTLIKLGFIEKTKIPRRYLYKYNNPYHDRYPKQGTTLYFD